uniref:Potassium channel domain-containing protein n=1 Tax=Parascaris univalens TaxID=6257 RepID=A0A915AGY5_PARUN
AFYLLALPVYTLFGALIFQALDGEHDDFMKRDYERRCQHLRYERLETLKNECIFGPHACFNKMRKYLEEVENCYRAWHEVNRTLTHPMSDFTNAIVYAFSVYTTIGYGNMAADTMGCRVATVIYGALGIPLFFAFIKEEGNLFRLCFIWIYKFIQKIHLQSCHSFIVGRTSARSRHRKDRANLTGTVAVLVGRTQDLVGRNPSVPFIRKLSTGSLFGTKCRHTSTSEQRRVFIAGVAVFIVYLLTISGVFTLMTDWDYFTAFYFLFNSVALIGFGDIFPAEPKIILVNTFFIVMGVVLFSMCYFILQEEIREKAFEASRRARMSISKYSHTLMQHTKNPWSRRNSPAFDSSGGSADLNSFDKLRKRRQSAPAISLTVPPFTLSPRSRSSK